jgi:hypothetical protein
MARPSPYTNLGRGCCMRLHRFISFWPIDIQHQTKVFWRFILIATRRV